MHKLYFNLRRVTKTAWIKNFFLYYFLQNYKNLKYRKRNGITQTPVFYNKELNVRITNEFFIQEGLFLMSFHFETGK